MSSEFFKIKCFTHNASCGIMWITLYTFTAFCIQVWVHNFGICCKLSFSLPISCRIPYVENDEHSLIKRSGLGFGDVPSSQNVLWKTTQEVYLSVYRIGIYEYRLILIHRLQSNRCKFKIIRPKFKWWVFSIVIFWIDDTTLIWTHYCFGIYNFSCSP